MSSFADNLFTNPGLNRRRYIRYSLNGSINGEMINQRGEKLTYMLVDVSKFGLGVIIDQPIEQYDKVEFKIEGLIDDTLKLEVQWVRSVPDENQVFRCGLHLTNENRNLCDLFNSVDTIQLEPME